MHELAVCQALIEQVETIARERHARRVDIICVSIVSGDELILSRVELLQDDSETDAPEHAVPENG